MTSFLFICAIVSGFILLIWGADKFIDGAAGIASNLGVAPLIVGLTIVGFGTSAPEMIVSAFAAFDGAPALGIGNAIGSNMELDRIDGLILFTGFILTLGGMAWLAVKSAQDDPLKIEFSQEYQQPKRSLKKSIILFLIGLIALLGGAKLLVWGATGVAQLLGISDLVIGLTVVAIGTSLPELAACI